MDGIIYIVIPVFNRLNFTIACLKSLNAQTLTNQVIIVDHGSSDSTSEIIKKDFPDVVVVKGDESLWWTGATNLGVKKALELSKSEQDLILTLNNDLEVDEDYLSELLKVYRNNIPCIVGSTSVDISNSERITFIGGTWNKYTAKFKRNILADLKYSEVAASYNSVEADLLPGRGVLIPIVAFRKLGLYDEKNFPHYGADDDFSLRCKNNGYKLLVAVKAIVRSHTDANGMSSIKTDSSFNRLRLSLTSIKSPNKLSTRYKWAKLNTPFPYLYILFDFSRIVVSILRSQYRTKYMKATKQNT